MFIALFTKAYETVHTIGHSWYFLVAGLGLQLCNQPEGLNLIFKQYLMSRFWVRVNCKKSTPSNTSHCSCSMSVVRLQLLKLTHSQIWLRNELRKTGYQNVTDRNLRKNKHI